MRLKDLSTLGVDEISFSNPQTAPTRRDWWATSEGRREHERDIFNAKSFRERQQQELSGVKMPPEPRGAAPTSFEGGQQFPLPSSGYSGPSLDEGSQDSDAVDASSSLSRLKCGNCSAPLTDATPGTDPTTATCAKCGTSNTFTHFLSADDDAAAGTQHLRKPVPEGMSARDVVDCRGCNAVFMHEGPDLSAHCPECRFPISVWSLRSSQRRQLRERLARKHGSTSPLI